MNNAADRLTVGSLVSVLYCADVPDVVVLIDDVVG